MAESTAVHDDGVHDGGGYAVELRGITKRFPGVVANSDINLAVRRGTVHALWGRTAPANRR